MRHILDHDTGLTDRDVAIILASLTNLHAAFDLQHMVRAKQGWQQRSRVGMM